MATCTVSGVHRLIHASRQPHDDLCALLRKLESRKVLHSSDRIVCYVMQEPRQCSATWSATDLAERE